MRRRAAVALLCLVFTTCASPSSGGDSAGIDTAKRAGATVTTQLGPVRSWTGPYVDGTVLRTINEERLVLVGASVYVVPFYADPNRPGRAAPLLKEVTEGGFTDRAELFRQMNLAGANTVRIPVSTTTYRDDDPYGLGKDGYLDRIEQLVDAATDAGLYTIIGWWDSLQMGPEFAIAYQRPFEMMRDVHERLGNRPTVFYEPHNEPNEISWSEWTEAMEATITYWRGELRYEGVLIVDTPQWSILFDPAQAQAILDLDAQAMNGFANLMFAHHRYARGNRSFATDRPKFEEMIGSRVGEFPLIVTETGAFSDGQAYSPDWFEGFLDHLVADSVPNGLNGVIVWNWNWGRPISEGGSSVLTVDGLSVLSNNGEIAVSSLFEPLKTP